MLLKTGGKKTDLSNQSQLSSDMATAGEGISSMPGILHCAHLAPAVMVCFPNMLSSLWLPGIFCSVCPERVSIPWLTLTHPSSISLLPPFFWKSSLTLRPELGPLCAVTAPITLLRAHLRALPADMFASQKTVSSESHEGRIVCILYVPFVRHTVGIQ